MFKTVRNRNGEIGQNLLLCVGALALFITLMFATGWGWAHFRLWKAEYSGKAFEIEKEYKGKAIKAEAEYARQVKVSASQAELEAANNTAKAIEIVGEAAKKYPEYRQQEFFTALGEALQNGNIQQIMYIPTEGLLPITEAGKRP